MLQKVVAPAYFSPYPPTTDRLRSQRRQTGLAAATAPLRLIEAHRTYRSTARGIDDDAWPQGICGAVMALEVQDVAVDTLQRRILQRHRAGHRRKPIGDESVDKAFRTI